MKLPEGVTVHCLNKTYKNEIPDNLVSDGLKKKFNKSSSDEQALKKPLKKVEKVDGN